MKNTAFNSSHLFYKKHLILLLCTHLLLWGCKKDNQTFITESDDVISPLYGNRKELTLDSIYAYAKQVYLWNTALPTYESFAPRENYHNIQPEIVALNKELFDISQLAINPVTSLPYEHFTGKNPKYSYLQLGTVKPDHFQAGVNNKDLNLTQKTFISGQKTIAYLAINTFPILKNSKAQLDKVFKEFTTEKPGYLIVDLRYNNGGYIETAEYVANLIAPSSLNGKLMYTEKFNETLQDGKGNILRNQPYLDDQGNTVIYKGRKATMADVDYTEAGNTYKFEKKGALESIKDLYFIISGETASASELLINVLKPYFNVILVGEKSFGKPVGFFGINIDRYSVYLSSFLIKNAQGYSEYYEGIEPDIYMNTSAILNLGNPEELCLKTCISLIEGEKVNTTNRSIENRAKSFNQMSHPVGQNIQLNGKMIESRLKLKKQNGS